MNCSFLSSCNFSIKSILEPLVTHNPQDGKITELLKKHLLDLETNESNRDPSLVDKDLEFLSHLIDQRGRAEEKAIFQKVVKATADQFKIKHVLALDWIKRKGCRKQHRVEIKAFQEKVSLSNLWRRLDPKICRLEILALYYVQRSLRMQSPICTKPTKKPLINPQVAGFLQQAWQKDAHLHADAEIALILMRYNLIKLTDISPVLQSNKAFIIEAVKQDGKVLECVSDELKNDREIVLAALAENGLYHFQKINS